mmetsp:Transcript_13424/g.46013  ORF Transcript_13424/g.46013 Transcript_13424/m.46013 type:complete len:245 (-) Transcript_13424:1336-2070(-)
MTCGSPPRRLNVNESRMLSPQRPVMHATWSDDLPWASRPSVAFADTPPGPSSSDTMGSSRMSAADASASPADTLPSAIKAGPWASSASRSPSWSLRVTRSSTEMSAGTSRFVVVAASPGRARSAWWRSRSLRMESWARSTSSAVRPVPPPTATSGQANLGSPSKSARRSLCGRKNARSTCAVSSRMAGRSDAAALACSPRAASSRPLMALGSMSRNSKTRVISARIDGASLRSSRRVKRNWSRG